MTQHDGGPAQRPGSIFSRLHVTQFAWVVESLDDAMAGWLAAGVGPFFTMDVSWATGIHRGAPAAPLSIRVGLAQAGGSPIELIEQISPGTSVFRDVVAEGSTGIHHVCRFSDDLEADEAALRGAGIEIVADLPRQGGGRTIFADTRPQLGCMLELLTATDYLRGVYALVEGESSRWDGRSDPVRPVSPDLVSPHLNESGADS